MANEEHLTLLQQGTATWNEWRETNPASLADLSRANLSGAKLDGADLRQTDRSMADLRHANLSGALLNQISLGSWHARVRFF